MSKKDLQNQIEHIAKTIDNPPQICRCCGHQWHSSEEYEECPDCCSTDCDTMSGFDYLEDMLDINYVVDSSKEYKGARILVAFGGPNIWIDTCTNKIEGYWWGDYAETHYNDCLDLDFTCSEIFAC